MSPGPNHWTAREFPSREFINISAPQDPSSSPGSMGPAHGARDPGRCFSKALGRSRCETCWSRCLCLLERTGAQDSTLHSTVPCKRRCSINGERSKHSHAADSASGHSYSTTKGGLAVCPTTCGGNKQASHSGQMLHPTHEAPHGRSPNAGGVLSGLVIRYTGIQKWKVKIHYHS